MKLQLNGLVYTTDSLSKIERLLRLGAVEIKVPVEEMQEDMQEDVEVINMTREQIMKTLEEKGIEFNKKSNKNELLALLD